MTEVDYTALERGRTPYEAWQKARELRDRRPYDYDLASYEHELYMRYMAPKLGIAAPFLVPGYELTKQFFQQSPVMEMLGQGRLGRLGGLLSEPVIDPVDARRTSPASFGSVGSGLLGVMRGYLGR